MKLHNYRATETSRRRLAARSGFTLVEVLVASTLGLLVLSGAMLFMDFAGKSFSGIAAQSLVTGQAGNAIEFIQSRARLATSVSNDASGNVLILSFDDDFTKDSNKDEKPYNDRDHLEQFQFRNGDGKDSTTSDNSLIYLPLANETSNRVLIPSGLHKLPGKNVFSVTNGATVLVRFGIIDSYARDHYQGIEIQGTVVPLNRPSVTNVVSIIP